MKSPERNFSFHGRILIIVRLVLGYDDLSSRTGRRKASEICEKRFRDVFVYSNVLCI